MTEPLLRLADVADELSVSLSTVKRLVRAGEIPVVRVAGSAVRVRPVDLRRYVASRTELRAAGPTSSTSPAGVALRKDERLWD